MAFSVDAWGQPPVMPYLTANPNPSVLQPHQAKLQLTPALDIEPTVISKWTPVIAFPVFAR